MSNEMTFAFRFAAYSENCEKRPLALSCLSVCRPVGMEHLTSSKQAGLGSQRKADKLIPPPPPPINMQIILIDPIKIQIK